MSKTVPSPVMTLSVVLGAFGAAASGCKKHAEQPPAVAQPTPPPVPTPPPQPTDAKEPALAGFKEITGFSTPESVLVVPNQDYYLVSNINGAPTDVDGNGFISKLGYDGTISALKWIDGASKIELNAPKGMAIIGDTLYVTDITTVRMFNLATGEAAGDIAIPGATFLNDIAADGDALYVSDTGVDASFKPTGKHAVYKIAADKKITKLIEGAGAEGPNGVLVENGQVWVASFASPELYRVADGKKADVQTMKTGGLDGLVSLGDGRIAVSSWEGKAIYAGKPGEPFVALVSDVESPADFAVDVLKKRVVVPLFQSNAVRFYEYK